MVETQVIKDELCSCGHKGSEHNPSRYGQKGQGPCRIKGCKCRQFRWKAFLDKEGRILK